MNWFYLSLLSALAHANSDALCKKALKESGVLTVALVYQGYCAVFLSPLLVFVGVPELDSTFFFTTLLLVPLEVTALILYQRAIKVSPLSLTLPFLSLTPVFLLLTSFLMLGERPDKSGMVGVVLVATGAYLLNVHLTKEGLLAPFRVILREEGSLLMIIVALIYSITSNLGKVAIQHSSPLFFATTYPAMLAIVLLPIAVSISGLSPLTARPALFGLIGLFNAMNTLAHCHAISLVEVPYMISVKRTSLLIGVLYGWAFFGETHLRERLLGSAVMLLGMTFIVVL
ncbi:MAG: DMT family transporter [Candidatus Brocadiaceae bacterium]|nr:DMT family transporter [Candidatus Brocadiaceae bacterium]